MTDEENGAPPAENGPAAFIITAEQLNNLAAFVQTVSLPRAQTDGPARLLSQIQNQPMTMTAAKSSVRGKPKNRPPKKRSTRKPRAKPPT